MNEKIEKLIYVQMNKIHVYVQKFTYMVMFNFIHESSYMERKKKIENPGEEYDSFHKGFVKSMWGSFQKSLLVS